ncbi:FAD-dependent oxidoreductase [Candidatus Peregrinibacteria bacterium]|nr:FAD-dependent oxidoreductase [Candidatus Peregrinibacteria bacterium]
MSQQIFDVIAVGAGVAGLSAGMYCGRFNLKTLVIGEMPGGVITTTHLVENYPGIISITGADMGDEFLEHAQKFGAEIKFSRVGDIEKFEEKGKQFFRVRAAGEEFIGRAIIIATGTQHKQLGVKGEKEFAGKGVSYCALCDAAFFKGKTVCLVGGGDSSAIEALILAQQCKKVYMIVRKDILRAEPINHKKVMESKNIEVKFLTEIAEIKGNGKVESVVFKSGEQMPMDGVFIAVGHVPASVLAGKLGIETDSNGQIKINRNSETNIPGVFAAGDVTDARFKQAITGAAEAVTASYSAYQYIQKTKV